MILPTSAFVYEFLYRGRAADDPTPPEYHIIIGIPAKDGLGNPTLTLTKALTPQQAIDAGLPLPVLLNGFNAALTTQITSLNDKINAQNSQLETHTTKIAEAIAALQRI